MVQKSFFVFILILLSTPIDDSKTNQNKDSSNKNFNESSENHIDHEDHSSSSLKADKPTANKHSHQQDSVSNNNVVHKRAKRSVTNNKDQNQSQKQNQEQQDQNEEDKKIVGQQSNM